jgi:hypothetical protein
MANFLGPSNFFLVANQLLNFNYNHKTKQHYFWQFANDASPYSVIYYSNQANDYHTLNASQNIDAITLNILDDDGNFVNFHGVEWSISIEVETFYEKVLDPESFYTFLENSETITYADPDTTAKLL